MASQEESDEDFLDDPIRLIDFEQRRFAELTNILDTSETVFEIIDSDEDLYIEKSSVPPKKLPNAGTSKVATSLPVKFFDISGNVKLPNGCKPLSVKLVNCEKYPWYIKKYQSQLTSDADKEVEFYCNINQVIAGYDTMIDEEGKRIRIRPVSSPYQNLRVDSPSTLVDKSKHRKSTENDSSKKWEKDVKKKELDEINLSHLDFKKNQGLIGMKITQTSESKITKCTKGTKPRTNNSDKAQTKKDIKTDTNVSKQNDVSKSEDQVISKRSDTINSAKVNKIDKDIKHQKSQIKSEIVPPMTLGNTSNKNDDNNQKCQTKPKKVPPKMLESKSDNADNKYNQKSELKPKAVNSETLEKTNDKNDNYNKKTITAHPETLEDTSEKNDNNNKKSQIKPKAGPTKSLENTSNTKKSQFKPKKVHSKTSENTSDMNDNQTSKITSKTVPLKILESISHKDDKYNQKCLIKPETVPPQTLGSIANVAQPIFLTYSKEIKETEKTDDIIMSKYIGQKLKAQKISETDWAIPTSKKVNNKKASDTPKVNNVLNTQYENKEKNKYIETKLKKESTSLFNAEMKIKKSNVPDVPVAAKKKSILNMEIFKPKKKPPTKRVSKKTVKSASEKSRILIDSDATKTHPPAEQNNNIEVAHPKSGNVDLSVNKIVKNPDLKSPFQNKILSKPAASNHQISSDVTYLENTNVSNIIVPEYIGCTVGKRQSSSYYVEKLAQMTQSKPQNTPEQVNVSQVSFPSPIPQLGSQHRPVIVSNEQFQCYANALKNKTAQIKQKASLYNQPNNPTSQINSNNITQTANQAPRSNVSVEKHVAKNLNHDVQENNRSIRLPVIENVVIQNPQNCKPPKIASTNANASDGARIFKDMPVTCMNSYHMAQPQNNMVMWKNSPKILKNGKNKTGVGQSQLQNKTPTASKITNQTMFINASSMDKNAVPVNISNSSNAISPYVTVSQTQNNVPPANFGTMPPLSRCGPPSSNFNNSNTLNGMATTSSSFSQAPAPVALSKEPTTANCIGKHWMTPTSISFNQSNSLTSHGRPIQTLISDRDQVPKPIASTRQNLLNPSSHETPHNFYGNNMQLLQPHGSQDQYRPMYTEARLSMGGQQILRLYRGIQEVEQQQTKLNSQETKQPMAKFDPRRNVQQVLPPTCDVAFGKSVTPLQNESNNTPHEFNNQMVKTLQSQQVVPHTNLQKKVLRRIIVHPNNLQSINPNAVMDFQDSSTTIPRHESPQHYVLNNYGTPIPHHLQPYGPRFQSPAVANNFGVRPFQNYVKSVPLYKNFPQNMNPVNPTPYQTPNCYQYPPPRLPPPPGLPPPPPPPYLMQMQQPTQIQNLSTLNLNTASSPKVVAGTIIGCNNRGPVRKINIHADNFFAENKSVELDSSKLLEPAQPSINQNSSGYEAKIHIKQNDFTKQNNTNENPTTMSNIDGNNDFIKQNKTNENIATTFNVNGKNYITKQDWTNKNTAIIKQNKTNENLATTLNVNDKNNFTKQDWTSKNTATMSNACDKNDYKIQNITNEIPAITANITGKNVTSSIIKSNSNEKSVNSESVNTKREMLEELSKITTMGSPMASPNESTKRLLSNNDKVQDKDSSPSIVKRPRPGPLSKKIQLSAVAHKGYSPPILPIPTYKETLELLSKRDMVNPRLLFMTEHEEESENSNSEPVEKVTKRRLETNETPDDFQAKKISLDEYKNRVPKPDDIQEAESRDGLDLSKIKIEIKSENTDQDLGYDSADSTMKV